MIIGILALTISHKGYAQEEVEGLISVDEINKQASDADKNSEQPYTKTDIPIPDVVDKTLAPLLDDEEAIKAAENAAAMIDKPMKLYQQCVQNIIADTNPASSKRSVIDVQCAEQRQAIAEKMPEELQGFLLLNMDRRLDAVLQALIDSQGVLEDSLEDSVEVIEILTSDAVQE